MSKIYRPVHNSVCCSQENNFVERLCEHCGANTSHCGGKASNVQEYSICGVCDSSVCAACQDWRAGCGKAPFADQDVVCNRCAEAGRKLGSRS